MNKKIILAMCFAFVMMIGNSYALYDQLTAEIKLTDNTGTILSGTYNFSFNIYDSYTGGSSLYESNQTLTTDSNGLVSVTLKDVDLNFSSDYYLGVIVGSDAESTPRINLTDIGNAIRSNETEYFNGLSSDSYLNDTDFGSAGLMKTDGSGSYSSITDASSNWNTAYGWGDHALAGYFTDISNFTGTLTNAKWCVYDSANTEIDCNVEPVIGDNSTWNQSLADTLYISQADEGNLNVNSSDFWDNIDTPEDFTNISVSGYYMINGVQLDSDDIPDHDGHSVKDTFNHVINRGNVEEITITETGGLGINWTAGELYDSTSHSFFKTTAGSGTLTNNAVNYLKWVSGTGLTISTSTASNNEILLATFSVYDGNINGYRKTSIMDESIANTRRGLRTAFPNRIIKGMSVSEDTDGTNALDVSMSSGELIKDGIELRTPSAIYSRNTPLIRHFHTSGVWDSDTNAEINTIYYDTGTDLAAIPSNKWVKAYFIFMNGKIGFIYPSEYFSTKAQALEASLPVSPPGLESVPKLTAIVYQQGDTDFTSTTWQDIRPGISEESFNIVTDHGALAGLSDDDHPQYLLADGTRALTGDWNAGAHAIIASTFMSNIATGTAPLTVSSTTQVANLNVSYAGKSYDLICTDCIGGTEIAELMDDDVSNTLTVTGYMQDEDINTFSEIQSWVSDKTLMNAEDVFTINANWINTAYPWSDNEVSDTLTCSNLVSASAVVDISTETNLAVGTGITLTDDTLTVVGGTAITADAGGVSVTADAIGDTQLEYNTGQHLTTTSDVTFNNVTVDHVVFENDATHHIRDNSTCVIITAGATTLEICE